MRKYYYVYILASLSAVLYAGLTDHLPKRLLQHKNGTFDGFTRRYHVNRRMYFEVYTDSKTAEFRELQGKGYRRSKKIALFAKSNPEWRDLSAQVFAWGMGPGFARDPYKNEPLAVQSVVPRG